MAERPSKVRDWIAAHVNYQGDDCLEWPFARHAKQSYGHMGGWKNGKHWGCHAHTYMCEQAHGPAPTPKHQAAHNCGNRVCVNPNHLEWKTRSGNQFDRKRHGTNKTSRYGNRPVLTNEQYDAIRALKGRETLAVIAGRFGVSIPTIHRIQNTTKYPRLPTGPGTGKTKFYKDRRLAMARLV